MIARMRDSCRAALHVMDRNAVAPSGAPFLVVSALLGFACQISSIVNLPSVNQRGLLVPETRGYLK